jgi:CheY-like chemotaxis protein
MIWATAMPTVMLVDDTASARLLLARLLRRDGYTVVCAEDGPDALGQLDAGVRPDMILLDYMMPGVDGLDVLAEIKSHPETSRTPVVMFTAVADQRVQDRATELGASDYVVKAAVEWDDLRLRLRRLAGPTTA